MSDAFLHVLNAPTGDDIAVVWMWEQYDIDDDIAVVWMWEQYDTDDDIAVVWMWEQYDIDDDIAVVWIWEQYDIDDDIDVVRMWEQYVSQCDAASYEDGGFNTLSNDLEFTIARAEALPEDILEEQDDVLKFSQNNLISTQVNCHCDCQLTPRHHN